MDLKDFGINLESITDPNIRRCIVGLLNIIQQLSEENTRLRTENQQLRDEIARLKGEQGKPNIPPNRGSKGTATDHSSEKHRKESKKNQARTVKPKKIEIDRRVLCPVDPATLPPDAEYKGIETRVIQEIVFRRDNLAFEREKYYAPSTRKTYLGPLPAGYAGYHFGPGIRSLALTLYYATGTSEPKILELFDHVGVQMSAAELSALLIHDVQTFHQEKTEVHKAGMASSPWQQIDDTGTRVNGVGHHCHIVGNPLFTIYSTQPSKDRITVIDVLRGQQEHRFRVNDKAVAYAAAMEVPGGHLGYFQKLPWDVEVDEATFTQAFDAQLSWVGKKTRKKLYEAAALAAYHTQTEMPVVHTLLGDDAGQFDQIAHVRVLCWIHEGRHYAKLTPYIAEFQKELDVFQNRFWDYYRALRAYQKTFENDPSPAEPERLQRAAEAERLRRDFDTLFATKPDYAALATRIASTRTNKAKLLQVLDHPELPLHNNASELAARTRVRKRDVSFQPRTQDGAKAWDTFHSLISTAKKLCVNTYEYIQDRVRRLDQIPSLATLITQRAAEMKLGRSWQLPTPSG